MCADTAVNMTFSIQDSVNLEEEIYKIDKGSPYILCLASDVGHQYFVVIERKLLAESGNLTTALINLIAVYFTFDVVYPKPLYSVFIFIQHYLFNLPDQQEVPNNAKILYSSVSKIAID